MTKVYIIEDDEDINELLVYNLKKENFEVRSFLNGKEGLEAIKKDKPDIVILDIMLPDIDGIEICKTLKSSDEYSNIPIIMLTAKSTEIDKIVGLELGADDYITKPFSFRELIARVKAVLRRYNRNKNEELKEKGFTINKETLKLIIDDRETPLTLTEYKLLSYLIKNKNKLLTRESILNTVWGEKQYDVYDRTIDVHIKKLREKLDKYGKNIKTVRGLGYIWEEKEEDE